MPWKESLSILASERGKIARKFKHLSYGLGFLRYPPRQASLPLVPSVPLSYMSWQGSLVIVTSEKRSFLRNHLSEQPETL